MDETGTAIGDTQSTRVITVIHKDKTAKAYKAKPARGKWVTSIKCLTASGRLIPLLRIFKGTLTLNEIWLPRGMTRGNAEIQGLDVVYE